MVLPRQVTPATGGIMKYVFYGTTFIFIVILILLTLHYTTFGIFSLDPTSGAIITTPLTISGTNSSYTTSTIPPYVSTTFDKIKQLNYTVSFDVFISSSLNTGNAYRVIFYNGKRIREPSKPRCGTNPPDGICDANLGGYLTTDPADPTKPEMVNVTSSSLSSIQAGLFSNSSNICMYMDPSTNDVYLTYYTAGGVSPQPVSGSLPNCGSDSIAVKNDDEKYICESISGNGWQTSAAIQNVPLQKPFRVTLAIDPNFIETYINGNLVLTTKTKIRSELYTYPSDNRSGMNFCGPPMFSPGCKVGNIQYWDQVLPAKSIRLFSSSPAAEKIFTQS